jgi:type IV secretion system protein TrbI
MAGTVIAASLVTGLNSDLPGFVIAQVTEHVYDTVSGRFLLIPQGSRLVGKYDSIVAFGQERALVVWQRIILPDGSSIVIDNLPATDTGGYAGLADQVDLHTWKMLKGVALATVLGVGSELAFGSGDNDLVKALQQSTQSTTNRAGQRLVERNLNVQPTITSAPAGRCASSSTRTSCCGPTAAPPRNERSTERKSQCRSLGRSPPSRTGTPAPSARSP